MYENVLQILYNFTHMGNIHLSTQISAFYSQSASSSTDLRLPYEKYGIRWSCKIPHQQKEQTKVLWCTKTASCMKKFGQINARVRFPLSSVAFARRREIWRFRQFCQVFCICSRSGSKRPWETPTALIVQTFHIIHYIIAIAIGLIQFNAY